jgi:hypothetical protein
MSMRPQVIIEVNPKHFLFTFGEEKLALEPVISVRKDDPETIASVGETPKEEGILSVSLFDAQQKIPPGSQKIDFLSAFIGYGMRVAMLEKVRSSLRPRVVFRGADSLHQALCGYQRALLEIAATNGGAKEVVFE